MKLNRRWVAPIIADTLAVGIWALAAARGYGWEMLWLPAVVIGAGWARDKSTSTACIGRLKPMRRDAASLATVPSGQFGEE